jgi:hypothetical protein
MRGLARETRTYLTGAALRSRYKAYYAPCVEGGNQMEQNDSEVAGTYGVCWGLALRMCTYLEGSAIRQRAGVNWSLLCCSSLGFECVEPPLS